MNREIKFRAWDAENEVMHNTVNLNEGVAFLTGYQWLNKESRHGKLTLMQYTGLKDKNGQEIYEGDIVQHSFDTGAKDAPRKVEFLNCCYQYAAYYYSFEHGASEVEVIGNIHENPELLEES